MNIRKLKPIVYDRSQRDTATNIESSKPIRISTRDVTEGDGNELIRANKVGKLERTGRKYSIMYKGAGSIAA